MFLSLEDSPPEQPQKLSDRSKQIYYGYIAGKWTGIYTFSILLLYIFRLVEEPALPRFQTHLTRG